MIKIVFVKLFSFSNGTSIVKNVSLKLVLHQWRGYSCQTLLLEGVLVIKNVSVKLFSFINGGSIGDEERVCQTLQFLQWRYYW